MFRPYDQSARRASLAVGSILGNRVQRVEDPRMLTVGGTYVEDVPIDAAWVHFVRSEYAHGRILSYDVDDARKVPGVLGVFTGEDVDLPPFPHVQPILKTGSERPLIAKGTVRFVGEPVVAIVAVDRHTAVDAGAMVYIDIEPLRAVVDSRALLDKTLVHPDLAPTPTPVRFEHRRFSECEIVSRLLVSPEVNVSPIEPRRVWLREPIPAATPRHYSSCQALTHPLHIAKIYRPPDRRFALSCPTAARFGVSHANREDFELAGSRTSRHTGSLHRTLPMRGSDAQAGSSIDVKIGGRPTERHRVALEVVQTRCIPAVGATCEMTRAGPRCLRHPIVVSRSVGPTTNAVTASRGACRLEAALAIERAVDSSPRRS